MHKFLKLCTVLIISLIPSTLIAQWQIETFEHIAENSHSQSATIKNADGFELAIFKTAEGMVWMDFSLSDDSFDELSQNQLPLFQIDNQKPVQMLRGFTATIVPPDEGIEAIIIDSNESISTEKDFSVNHIIAERLPERVICPIWQGMDRPHLNTLESLQNGQVIKFDFVLINGEAHQTSFTLEGAKRAIEKAIYQ